MYPFSLYSPPSSPDAHVTPAFLLSCCSPLWLSSLLYPLGFLGHSSLSHLLLLPKLRYCRKLKAFLLQEREEERSYEYMTTYCPYRVLEDYNIEAARTRKKGTKVERTEMQRAAAPVQCPKCRRKDPLFHVIKKKNPNIWLICLPSWQNWLKSWHPVHLVRNECEGKLVEMVMFESLLEALL